MPPARSGDPGAVFDPDQAFDQLSQELVERAEPDRVAAAEAYMRNQFEFLGVRSANVREAIKPIIANAKDAPAAALIEFSDACWAEDEREYQYAAALLLRRRVSSLGPEQLVDARRYVTTKSWWDTVDSLAAWVVGRLVFAHPELAEQMDIWIDDDDLWVRRTAILHQLTFKAATDEERLFRYCLDRAGETEFFIRKAIGWALRQYGRTAPDRVRAFVTEHDDVWSGLTRREALKRL